MGKTPATIAAGVCWFLAFLWFLAICTPMNWIWCENLVVRLRINLFAMKISKGLLTWAGVFLVGVTKSQLMEAASQLFEMDAWLEDGTHRLCAPAVDLVWRWCDEALMLKYASFAMVFFGFMTSAFLTAAGVFMYYYVHEHATHTGRKWALGCLIGAPVCSFIGVLQYALLTMNFSESMYKFGLGAGATFMYGPGFFICCMLTLASCVPIYIHYGFVKKSLYEKNDYTSEYDPSLNSGGFGGHGGYGAAGNQAHSPPMAGQAPYGAPAPMVHVTQVQVPLAPQIQNYQGPGAGQPAW